MNKYKPILFINTTTQLPIDTLTITDTDTYTSEVIGLGVNGFGSAFFAINNAGDQSVAITVQGRNDPDDAWRTALAATTVTASGTGAIYITKPWGEIRLSIVYAVASSAGALRVDCILSEGVGAEESATSGDVVITDIEGFDTVKGQATMAESLPFVIASDQSAVFVKQRGDTISVTPTVTAGAYSAGDCVGGVMEFANAARTTGEGGFVTDVAIIDDAGQDAALELWLFDQTFTSPGDNAAWAATEAELHNLVGIWATDDGQWRAAGTPSVCHLKEVARFQAVGTSLFGQLVTRGTPTFAATDDVTVKIKVAQDD